MKIYRHFNHPINKRGSTRASKDNGRSSSSSRGVAVVVPQQPDEPDNPDEFSTDLVTLRRLGPISEEMPEIDPPEWTDQQKPHDRLVFYDADQVVHVASLTECYYDHWSCLGARYPA